MSGFDIEMFCYVMNLAQSIKFWENQPKAKTNCLLQLR